MSFVVRPSGESKLNISVSTYAAAVGNIVSELVCGQVGEGKGKVNSIVVGPSSLFVVVIGGWVGSPSNESSSELAVGAALDSASGAGDAAKMEPTSRAAMADARLCVSSGSPAGGGPTGGSPGTEVVVVNGGNVGWLAGVDLLEGPGTGSEGQLMGVKADSVNMGKLPILG